MGYYIQGPSKGKAQTIIAEHDAVEITIEEAVEIMDDPDRDQGVICVVDNGPFEAAGYAFDKKEFEVFAQEDGRPKTWLAMSRGKAEELCGYGK